MVDIYDGYLSLFLTMQGSRMVRELFVMAREASPSIIFMDEIDSIGSSRVEGSEGGDSEVQRTMLELLNQLDGFEPTQNIKVRASSSSSSNNNNNSTGSKRCKLISLPQTQMTSHPPPPNPPPLTGDHVHESYRYPGPCPPSPWTYRS